MTIFAKIKAVWSINKEIKKMKISELSTSSGRTMWLMSIAGIVSAVMGFLPATLVAKLIAMLATAYTVYRTVAPALESIAAKTKTPVDDAILAEISADVKALTDKFGTPKDVADTKDTDNVKTE